MRKCFEFSAGIKGTMREFPDGKAMFEFCDMRREEEKKGFLVRAETKDEAIERLNTITPTSSTINQYYIL